VFKNIGGASNSAFSTVPTGIPPWPQSVRAGAGRGSARGFRSDALHLALASFHACDILLTWNCKHLANANKTGHIHHVNALLGIRVPVLAMPNQLLEDDDYESS